MTKSEKKLNRYSPQPLRLFYAYSHKDQKYREDMETALNLLQRRGLLKQWSDRSIVPGTSISKKRDSELKNADIVAFLISPDFIGSEECINEWKDAKKMVDEGALKLRVPVILRDCSWLDFIGEDDVKALPEDGKAIVGFSNKDEAWKQVYEGIKQTINEVQNTFLPKEQFLKQFQSTDFVSEEHIDLQDIFVFPSLLRCHYSSSEEKQVETEEQLLKEKKTLIHGDEMSGKTALARHLYLFLVGKGEPVLHIDLNEVPQRPKETFIQNHYSQQFTGDYYLWKSKENKTLILDNLSSGRRDVDFINYASDFFERIIVMVHSDIFRAYYNDDRRFADFSEVRISDLTHVKQEKLIRKRLSLSKDSNLSDGFIDKVERKINSVIINSGFVPRYPFYVLSILQTYEGYMPTKFDITSQAHCYYALILAHMIKSNISKDDSDINTCFNFLEKLAFRIHEHTTQNNNMNRERFTQFVQDYKTEFSINDSIIKRLQDDQYGLISHEGNFKAPYAQYFFSGEDSIQVAIRGYKQTEIRRSG